MYSHPAAPRVFTPDTEHDHGLLCTRLWPEPRGQTQMSSRVRSFSGCRCRTAASEWLRLCVCCSAGRTRSLDQRVSRWSLPTLASLAPHPPSSDPGLTLLQWQESKVRPGKGSWLEATDILAFLCVLNRSQQGLSLEINGPQSYLNTQWPWGWRGRGGGEVWGGGGHSSRTPDFLSFSLAPKNGLLFNSPPSDIHRYRIFEDTTLTWQVIKWFTSSQKDQI